MQSNTNQPFSNAGFCSPHAPELAELAAIAADVLNRAAGCAGLARPVCCAFTYAGRDPVSPSGALLQVLGTGHFGAAVVLFDSGDAVRSGFTGEVWIHERTRMVHLPRRGDRYHSILGYCRALWNACGTPGGGEKFKVPTPDTERAVEKDTGPELADNPILAGRSVICPGGVIFGARESSTTAGTTRRTRSRKGGHR